MVSTTTHLPQGDALGVQDVRSWLKDLAASRTDEEMEMITAACGLALNVHQESREPTGESTLRHALAVAEILEDMALDWETLVAAILHDVLPSDQVDAVGLEGRFGSDVARMVGDMARIGNIIKVQSEARHRDEVEHTENIRRMLLSIADDIRVVLIVLAERLHVLRILKHLPGPLRVAEAKETQLIYAPMANRLGIWQIKWEMEDLCLRYLEPESYKEIAGNLDGRRADREVFITEVINLLQEKFAAIGIHGEISGRPKHIYSIWKKMQRKSVEINQIFDLRAVRVLVDDVAECYAALGVVHGLWRHIPGEFDDYIATPKANMYRSIHTAVIGPEEKTLEVQIRSRKMHEHAELGVAAHWRYKESVGKGDMEFERRIALMRSWLDLRDDADSGSDEFADSLKSDFEAQQVYVLTPQGRVVELPKGATAIDFAYAIHTSVGHRCRGAKVNGHIIPLTQPLESGQTVHILTTKEGGPSRDWISPHLGYIKTGRARNRIRHWFKEQDYEAHLHAGRTGLEREVTRLGVHKPNLEEAAKRFNLKKSDDLLAAIGRGDISPIQVAGMGVAQVEEQSPSPQKLPQRRRKTTAAKRRSEVVVEGVSDLLTHMARCCKPVPYDDIIGFITRGKGVTVHRRDCSMIHNLNEKDQGRLASVVWADQQEETTYPVDIQVIAGDRKGLLRDLSSVLTNEEVDVIGVNTQSNRKTDRATMRFTVEISDMKQLSRIIDKMAQFPDILDVKRRV
ncbi:MAG: bifunctional (p)ppGpp synthetase/guanosine-3',5'-bis(diphosphate) 3'-pyrophosphohydrolase [Candidatus Sedimenticola sp. (ex Thyasira tokunagai)]